MKARHKLIIDMLKNIPKRSTILDVGAYPFIITNNLRQQGHVVETISSKVVCDIEKDNFQYKTNKFDYVLFNSVIEHLGYDPIHTLKEINRVLKLDGELILTTPNLYYLPTILKFFLGCGLVSPKQIFTNKEKGYLGHIKEYSMYELIEMLEYTGFKIKSKQYKYLNNHRNRLIFFISNLISLVIPKFRETILIKANKGVDKHEIQTNNQIRRKSRTWSGCKQSL